MASWRSGSLETLPERMQVAIDEVDRLQAALATALADRDAHVRGYEDLEQRHGAVVAGRDEMRRERDEARFAQQAEHVRFVLMEGIGKACEKMRAERDALKAEVERLTKERDEAREDAAEDAGDYEKMLGEVRAERDALRAEVERLQYQCNEQVQENADLRAVTAARADGCSYCHGALLCPIHRGKHRAGKP